MARSQTHSVACPQGQIPRREYAGSRQVRTLDGYIVQVPTYKIECRPAPPSSPKVCEDLLAQYKRCEFADGVGGGCQRLQLLLEELRCSSNIDGSNGNSSDSETTQPTTPGTQLTPSLNDPIESFTRGLREAIRTEIRDAMINTLP
jgi:hypothetical protein